MALSIPIPGLASSDFVPGIYIANQFAQGPSAGLANPINALLMGNALASAPALRDGYVYGPNVEGLTCSSESDVINLFGNGSELHRAYRAFVKVNQSVTPVFFLAVSESAGAAATGTITLATTATANGSARVYVGAEFIDTAISSGDTPTVQATNIVANVNSKLAWAITAANTAGVITLTAKNKGPRGNFIRFACKLIGNGIGTTSSASNFSNLSGGTTEDNWSNALSTILSSKFRYIVASGEDATAGGNLGSLSAQVVSQAQPIVGIRQRVVAGNVSSLGTASTFARSLNNPRVDVIWQLNSNLTPFELAATASGAFCFGESQSVPILNWDSLGASTTTKSLWPVSAPFDGTTVSHATLASALASGLSPVATGQNGSSYLVSAITTYCQDPVSGNIDTRCRDHAIPTVMDLAADLVQQVISQKFSNKLLANDPVNGSKLPAGNVATPSIVKAAINKIIAQMGENGLLQNIAQTMAATVVNRESNPDSRLTILMQLQVISIWHQTGVLLNQISVQ